MANSAGSEPEAARVAARLRDEILDGVREPGGRLVERELAEAMSTSRVPVRDALKTLAGEGLVVLRPRTWAVVREFSVQDVEDLWQVRRSIEGLAFRLASVRCTEADVERLRAIAARELRAARSRDAVSARRAGADFHEAVIELAGNGVLGEVGSLMGSRMRWFMSQHDDLEEVAREHEALCDAIAAQDSEALDVLVSRHLQESAEHLRTHRERTSTSP
jgi:DNA-binding GntR family transcriptional regulator